MTSLGTLTTRTYALASSSDTRTTRNFLVTSKLQPPTFCTRQLSYHTEQRGPFNELFSRMIPRADPPRIRFSSISLSSSCVIFFCVLLVGIMRVVSTGIFYKIIQYSCGWGGEWQNDFPHSLTSFIWCLYVVICGECGVHAIYFQAWLDSFLWSIGPG